MARIDGTVFSLGIRPGRRERIGLAAAAVLALACFPATAPAQGPSTASASVVAASRPTAPQDSARRRQSRFAHGEHRGQPCVSCHTSRLRHGALRSRSGDDCARCHHTGPGREQCASCHDSTALAQPTARVAKAFRLQVSGREVRRNLPFPHARHTPAIPCAICHANTPTRTPDAGNCSLCHAAHHRPTSNCRTCHAGADPRASHRAAAHPNCAVSGCHGTRAPDITTSREPCLLCHADRERHMPGMLCSQCHRVTNPETRQ